jgi:hypothetical protein
MDNKNSASFWNWKLRTISNRKGIAMDDLIPIILLLLAAVVLIFIVFLYGTNEANTKFVELRTTHQGQMLLREYLLDTIEYNGEKMSILSFLIRSDSDDKNAYFQNHAKTYFSERWRIGCWEIQLRTKSAPILDVASSGTTDLKNCMENAQFRSDYSILLPTKNSEEPIYARLIIAK